MPEPRIREDQADLERVLEIRYGTVGVRPCYHAFILK